MPFVEVWERTGKGAMKFIHNLKKPVEVVAVEDVNGNMYPIYEGNNCIPAGRYCLVILRPYAKEGEKPVDRQSYKQIDVRNEDDVAYVVHESEFIGGYATLTADQWQSYAAKHGEKLARPVGWNARSAESMLLQMK